MKRTLKINFKDGSDIELPMIRGAKVRKSKKEFIYFDKREDGWTVVWTGNTFDEFAEVESIDVIREGLVHESRKYV